MTLLFKPLLNHHNDNKNVCWGWPAGRPFAFSGAL